MLNFNNLVQKLLIAVLAVATFNSLQLNAMKRKHDDQEESDSKRRKLEESQECPICNETYNNSNRQCVITLCQHDACSICADLMFGGINKGSITACHMCRQQVNFTDLKPRNEPKPKNTGDDADFQRAIALSLQDQKKDVIWGDADLDLVLALSLQEQEKQQIKSQEQEDAILAAAIEMQEREQARIKNQEQEDANLAAALKLQAQFYQEKK